MKTEDHLDLYSPNPENEIFYETTRKVIELVGEELAVGVLIDNIELTSESMGIEYFLMSFYRNRSFVEKCLRVRTDFVIEVSKRMIDLGVDVIVLGDDIADKHGPFISPENFSKHILPQYKRIVHAIHCKDTPVVCHSDGNMWPLLDLLVEADLDGFHPIEPQAGMDIKEVKQEYGDRFCLMGNVDCSHTLCIRPIDEVVEETKNCIAAGAPGGGFILSSSNSIHNAVKLDNYRSMVKVAKKYGQYPILL